MFDHVVIGLSDYPAGKTFFIEALAPLGVKVIAENALGVEMAAEGEASLGLSPAFGKAAPLHLAFSAASPGHVDAFYRAALAAGGQDNGAPGLRPKYHPGYYAAFVIGPDGHNIEAVHHDRSA
jgi:catechol 2,3-dioxygenase-like lactoylglutathione lyase family enzyme